MKAEWVNFWSSLAKLADISGVIGLIALCVAFFFGITTIRQCFDMNNETKKQAMDAGTSAQLDAPHPQHSIERSSSSNTTAVNSVNSGNQIIDSHDAVINNKATGIDSSFRVNQDNHIQGSPGARINNEAQIDARGGQ